MNLIIIKHNRLLQQVLKDCHCRGIVFCSRTTRGKKAQFKRRQRVFDLHRKKMTSNTNTTSLPENEKEQKVQTTTAENVQTTNGLHRSPPPESLVHALPGQDMCALLDSCRESAPLNKYHGSRKAHGLYKSTSLEGADFHTEECPQRTHRVD